MKIKFYRWYSGILGTLLALLGYSCDGIGNAPLEYGSPVVKYHLKGNVTTEDGTPLKGIKVSVEHDNYKTDSTQTDENGAYDIVTPKLPLSSNNMVTFEDIDGPANGGAFKNDTVKFTEKDGRKTGDGDDHWFVGTYEVDANKKLKRQ